MKNADSLKSIVANFAAKKNLRSQEVLQMYFFERILERLSQSAYKDNFIIKGGFLIASMIGIGNRTTMDIDTTVKGMPLNEESVRHAMNEILSIDVGDHIDFQMEYVNSIREDDDYDNFRVHLIASFGRIKTPMKIDVTTGDEITPGEIQWRYSSFFEDKHFDVMAYPLETVLAEEFETLIRRNIATTRMRDFYDFYSLHTNFRDEIDFGILADAIKRTSRRRSSDDLLPEASEIIEDIRTDSHLHKLWSQYANDHPFVGELDFGCIITCLLTIVEKLKL